MANDNGFGQTNFSASGPQMSRPVANGLPNTQPMTSRPISAEPPQATEDIFETVDKTGPIIYRPPMPTANPASTAPSAPVNNDRPQLRPVSNNAPMPQAPMPSSAGGSMKYLVIGVVTLLVVLAAGFAVYFFLLKPQFQTPVVVEDVNKDLMTPVATQTEQVAPITNDNITTEATSADSLNNTATTSSDLINNQASSTVGVGQDATLDSDGDRLTNVEEAKLGTNPNNPDTDGDGLNDYEEVMVYKTNPLDADTDGDGYPDGAEVKAGYDPNGPGRLLIIKK